LAFQGKIIPAFLRIFSTKESQLANLLADLIMN
jgi:hypothetical protein